MTLLVWFGTTIGAIAGLLHSIAMFRQRLAINGGRFADGAYFAVWTLALWVIFGAYVLVFWLLGAGGLVLSRLWTRSGHASSSGT